jgi:hypothetical protein
MLEGPVVDALQGVLASDTQSIVIQLLHLDVTKLTSTSAPSSGGTMR